MLATISRTARALAHDVAGVHDDWREFILGIGVEALFAGALALMALATVQLVLWVAA